MKLKIMVAVLFSVFMIVSLHASKGLTSASFLKLGFGARASGLGEAYTALATDATGEYWNIGAVAFADSTQLAIMHNNIYQDITHNYLSLIYKRNDYSFFTGGISYVNFGKFEKIRMNPNFYTPDVIGSYSSTNTVVSFGYSRRMNIIGDLPFSAGINIKSIISTIDVHTASAYAVDLGTYSQLNDMISVAFTVKNLGSKMKYVSVKEQLPLRYTLGFGLQFDNNILLSADINFARNDRETFSFGTEYTIKEIVALRAGYNSSNDLEDSVTNLGLGFSINNMNFDYAYLLFGVLGNSHSLSMNYKF